MPECLPEQAPCSYRGLQWFDWGWSLFKKACEAMGWLGALQDNTSVAAFGTVALLPALKEIGTSGSIQIVTIPAGAISIQALIDDEYAADYSLTVVTAEGDQVMPPGSDLILPVITPVFNADANGQDVTKGTGIYPSIVLRYPVGATGFVGAIYKGTAQTIVVT